MVVPPHPEAGEVERNPLAASHWVGVECSLGGAPEAEAGTHSDAFTTMTGARAAGCRPRMPDASLGRSRSPRHCLLETALIEHSPLLSGARRAGLAGCPSKDWKSP
ncbi:hypothetical protein NDU88_002862 [Pleurodeles waltl]|uniref:Uncharacterized protein n=1 Tax=Pleurodeles waltl TaxID=8319 RepID=A0AAV7RFR4_PLEWA|nr:hypothetical protein NDU88_002862 [Pleurodeles waltl]